MHGKAAYYMQLDGLISEWLELGKQDLDSATFLFKMYPLPLEIIGFHCQQAVEKFLKAYLIQQGQEPEKTYDLVFLLKLIIPFDKTFSVLTPGCAMLTDFAVKNLSYDSGREK